MIKEVGFNTTFLITAALQAISIACLLPLLRIVRAEHQSAAAVLRGGERAARSGLSGEGSDFLDGRGSDRLLPSGASVQGALDAPPR